MVTIIVPRDPDLPFWGQRANETWERMVPILRNRGRLITGHGDLHETLMPVYDRNKDWQYPQGKQMRKLLDQGSFRKMLRRLTAAHGGPTTIDALTAMAGAKTQEYMSFLVECGLAEQSSDAVWLKSDIAARVDNIGKTFECYVAEVCQMDLGSPAVWGALLDDSRDGDFDILTWIDPLLTYVECKSSHPDQITDAELLAFLRRRQDLGPDITILLVDTDSQGSVQALSERFAKLVHSIGWEHHISIALTVSRFFQIGGHLGAPWYGSPGVYIVGTRQVVEKSVRQCLSHYHRAVKGRVRTDESLDGVTWVHRTVAS